MTPPIRRRISEVKETRFTFLPETTTTKYIYNNTFQDTAQQAMRNPGRWEIRKKSGETHICACIYGLERVYQEEGIQLTHSRKRESLGRPRQREWIQQTTTEGRLSQRERQICAGDLLKIEQGTNLHKCEDTVSQGKHLLERTKKNNTQSWPKTENRGGPGKPRKAGSLGVGSQEEGPLRSGE